MFKKRARYYTFMLCVRAKKKLVTFHEQKRILQFNNQNLHSVKYITYYNYSQCVSNYFTVNYK